MRSSVLKSRNNTSIAITGNCQNLVSVGQILTFEVGSRDGPDIGPDPDPGGLKRAKMKKRSQNAVNKA
jgi:hypothetical protein